MRTEYKSINITIIALLACLVIVCSCLLYCRADSIKGYEELTGTVISSNNLSYKEIVKDKYKRINWYEDVTVKYKYKGKENKISKKVKVDSRTFNKDEELDIDNIKVKNIREGQKVMVYRSDKDIKIKKDNSDFLSVFVLLMTISLIVYITCLILKGSSRVE